MENDDIKIDIYDEQLKSRDKYGSEYEPENKYEQRDDNSQHINTENKQWNDAVEETVKYIGERCRANKIMHLHNAIYYNYIYQILMYIVIILSPVAGVIATFEAVFPQLTFAVLIAILTYISAILAGIVKFSGYNEKRDAHKLVSSKYSSLEMNVRKQLILNREDREPCNLYLNWASRALDEIDSSAPFISKRIYRKYVNFARKTGRFIPEAYDDIVEIGNNTKQTATNLYNEEEIKVNNGNNSNIKFIRRKDDNYLPVSELNGYSEERMRYEMQRFMQI